MEVISRNAGGRQTIKRILIIQALVGDRWEGKAGVDKKKKAHIWVKIQQTQPNNITSASSTESSPDHIDGKRMHPSLR